jgi:hypothetical protein
MTPSPRIKTLCLVPLLWLVGVVAADVVAGGFLAAAEASHSGSFVAIPQVVAT